VGRICKVFQLRIRGTIVTLFVSENNWQAMDISPENTEELNKYLRTAQIIIPMLILEVLVYVAVGRWGLPRVGTKTWNSLLNWPVESLDDDHCLDRKKQFLEE